MDERYLPATKALDDCSPEALVEEEEEEGVDEGVDKGNMEADLGVTHVPVNMWGRGIISINSINSHCEPPWFTIYP